MTELSLLVIRHRLGGVLLVRVVVESGHLRHNRAWKTRRDARRARFCERVGRATGALGRAVGAPQGSAGETAGREGVCWRCVLARSFDAAGCRKTARGGLGA